MPYAFVHNGRAIGPSGPIVDVEGTPLQPGDADAYNRAIEVQELARWGMQPAVPAGYYHLATPEFGQPYRASFRPSLTGTYVSTWLGTRLGVITSARVYRHNFGGRFVSLTVRGTNGATYYGRASYDWGTCIQLRRARARSARRSSR